MSHGTAPEKPSKATRTLPRGAPPCSPWSRLGQGRRVPVSPVLSLSASHRRRSHAQQIPPADPARSHSAGRTGRRMDGQTDRRTDRRTERRTGGGTAVQQSVPPRIGSAPHPLTHSTVTSRGPLRTLCTQPTAANEQQQARQLAGRGTAGRARTRAAGTRVLFARARAGQRG